MPSRWEPGLEKKKREATDGAGGASNSKSVFTIRNLGATHHGSPNVTVFVGPLGSSLWTLAEFRVSPA